MTHSVEPTSHAALPIAHALRRLYRDKWEVDALDRLLINKESLQAIKHGADEAAVEAIARPKIEDFLKQREKHLLYK